MKPWILLSTLLFVGCQRQSAQPETKFVTRPAPRYEFRTLNNGVIWRLDRKTGEAWSAIVGGRWQRIDDPVSAEEYLGNSFTFEQAQATDAFGGVPISTNRSHENK